MGKFGIALFFMLGFYANAEDVPVAEAVPIKPNPQYTTGDFCTRSDKDFQELRYKDKVVICVRDVSRELKAHIYDIYGVPRKCRKYYTVDHYIPLMMGGSNHPENLWPEHKEVKATRQNLEQELYERLHRGDIGQEYAVRVIVNAKQNPPHVRPKGCE